MYHPAVSITLYNLLLRLFGIQSQILDLDAITEGKRKLSTKIVAAAIRHLKINLNYWKFFSFVICVMFACNYPIAMYKLRRNECNCRQNVNLFISYLYYSSQFVVTIGIHFYQFQKNSEIIAEHIDILKMFAEIDDRSRQQNLCGKKNNQKSISSPFFLSSLNVLNAFNLAKILTILSAYTLTNVYKYYFVFNSPLNAFESIWYYYPTIFICLYSTKFSIGVLQQTKLFTRLNRSIKMAATDIINRSKPNKRRNAFIISGRNRNERFYARDKQFVINLRLHDELRTITIKLEKLHSLQIVSVIFNAFIHILAEVSVKHDAFPMRKIV